MKTISKSIVLVFIILSGTYTNSWAARKSNQDETKNKNFFEISGKIVDAKSNKQLTFASISVKGENTATISNLEGEFILKIDNSSNSKNIIISHLGYKNLVYPISSFKEKVHLIKLEPTAISLAEVVIFPKTPDQLVRLALDKVPENYENQPYKMTAFFREFIKKKRNYVSLAEAVLDIYKSNYSNEFQIDQTKILKGRKGTDKRRLDTLLFKVQGGPTSILLLDIVKNPNIIFSEENWKNYKFIMDSQVKIFDRINYVIRFEQAYRSKNPMHNGRLFIDSENLAITGVEFELNVLDAAAASRLFLRKKPAGVKLLPVKAVYKVMYKEQNGKWFFNYANAIVNFNIKWEKKLFATNYTTMLEIAITDRTSVGVERIKVKERFKYADYFTERVADFYDPDFWGSYNTIKPDESIETAIKRLKKVNR